jgi:hypothetical protein
MSAELVSHISLAEIEVARGSRPAPAGWRGARSSRSRAGSGNGLCARGSALADMGLQAIAVVLDLMDPLLALRWRRPQGRQRRLVKLGIGRPLASVSLRARRWAWPLWMWAYWRWDFDRTAISSAIGCSDLLPFRPVTLMVKYLVHAGSRTVKSGPMLARSVALQAVE